MSTAVHDLPPIEHLANIRAVPDNPQSVDSMRHSACDKVPQIRFYALDLLVIRGPTESS